MIQFRVSTDVHEDRRVVLELPPETPVGEADLMVTVTPRHNHPTNQTGRLRQLFGTVRSGDPRSGDNDQLDVDLARAYEDSHDEVT